jgi:endonuclease/exonuclease/phosphatase family metal-dependent hydrolase
LNSTHILEEQPCAAYPLRVAIWNLQSCRRGLPGILAGLKALDADLVALQEVDRCTGRSAGIDQAALLAREAGFAHHHFFPALGRDGGQYGIALLSRHPLLEPRLERLPTTPGIEPRVAGRARLVHPAGELTVAVTHLSHKLGNSWLRREQVGHLLGLLPEGEPCLLLGDFNDLPGSRVHRALCDRFTDVFAKVGQGPSGTHPFLGPWLPAVRIDFLFASRELELRSARVARTDASDHHALVAEIGAPAASLGRAANGCGRGPPDSLQCPWAGAAAGAGCELLPWTAITIAST